MPIFVFRSEKDKRHFAFAGDETRTTLPRNLGPWYQTDSHNVAAVVGLTDSVCAAIKAKGYVLMQIGRELEPSDRSRSTSTASPSDVRLVSA